MRRMQNVTYTHNSGPDNPDCVISLLLFTKNHCIMKNSDIFPEPSRELAEQKAALVMDNLKAWRKFSRTIFSEGALPEKTKQLIAVAVGHVTQCPYCKIGRAHV